MASIAIAMLALPSTVMAQAIDCTGLRSQIEAARPFNDSSRLDIAIRQQRAELDRTRAYADESGCNGTSLFDAADPRQCRMLAGRAAQLESGLQRLEDEAAKDDPGPDDRRRALVEQFNAYCAGAGDEAPDSRRADGAPNVVPVDPDAPLSAPPATRARFAHVFCVRQCDGAYYPLAVDVAADRLDGMDKICKAQCPNAEASAYTAGDGEDMGEAMSADGSPYSSMPAAFKFRTGVAASCSCRAPHQSWAEALAQADGLLEAHQGDVTVTREVAAAMSRPIPPAQVSAAPAKTASGKKSTKKAPPTDPAVPPLVISPPRGAAPLNGAEASAPNPGEDVTRQFRRSVPTL